ncbi:hypothetical protein HRG_005039 [Hirsutella rhossiliensis]|uniref:Uncharacterized protein n=1 Tax=Hirsutella rhossiliensis TaxID=111463 RepID=A0A9P8SKZ8_9HYPO|nr:uncharacterized protein HRG_05039 [Hirsutella rhossiliensis]KAH0964611.1 hypothetical protein HRG_05039 [Hirsutella rhossiliensis]
MTTYTVDINVDDYWVEQFNLNGYRLIMAKVFEDPQGNDYYNVVATADDVTPIMTAKWTDKYQITGSTQDFRIGNTISGISGEAGVKFQQSYVLDSWSEHHVIDDQSVPDNSFGFKNAITASAVVQLSLNGEWKSVYMSPLKFPPGKAILTPLPKVVFWFEARLESSTMIAMDQSNTILVNLTGSSSATLTYDKKGSWKRDKSRHDE